MLSRTSSGAWEQFWVAIFPNATSVATGIELRFTGLKSRDLTIKSWQTLVIEVQVTNNN